MKLAVAIAAVGVASITAVFATTRDSAHVIKLTGNRFTPPELVVHVGDSLRFVNGRGGLHNIVFREDSLPAGARDLLDAAMPGREDFRSMPVVPLSSPMLVSEGEVYAFAIPALPPGRYEYFCAPHFGAGMKGVIEVKK